MEKEKISKKGLIIIGILCVLFITIAIIGFILFAHRKEEVVIEEKNGGNVVLNYSSDTSFLNVQDAVPTTDAVGMATSEDGSYFDFSVDTRVSKAKNITYELSIKKVKGNVNSGDIKVYLEKEDSGTYNSVLKPTVIKELKKKTDIGTKSGNMVLVKESLKKTTKDNYRIRTWISESSLVPNANYQLQIDISAKAE